MKRHITIFTFLLGVFAALEAQADLQVWGYGIYQPGSSVIDTESAATYFDPPGRNGITERNVGYTISVKADTPGWAVDCWMEQRADIVRDYTGVPIAGTEYKTSYVYNDERRIREGGHSLLAVRFRYIKYKLSYDLDDGTSKSSDGESHDYDTQFSLDVTPMRTGYTFVNWLAEPVGETFAAGATVSGADLCPDTWHKDGSNVTMVAQWTERTYGISTSGENCAVTVSKSSGVGYTEAVTVSWDPQTPQGHSRRFKSAQVLAGETELKSFSSGTSGTFTMSTANKGYFENVTVRVVYEDTTNQYQVNVISGGNGSVSKAPDQSRYDYGSTVTISATPNRGYAFAFWSDGGAQTHDVTVGAADTTYTATFTNCVYTLTWDANGGKFADGSSVSNVLIAYDSPLGDLPLPTRDRMERDGWHTEESGGTVVDRDTHYTWDYDRKLYMHWQESHLYKIKTVASPKEGGTTEGDDELATGETTTLRATPNDGYSFKAWSDDGAQTHDVTVGLTDATYTATFTGNTYKVSFRLVNATTWEEYDGTAPKTIERTYGDVYGELPLPTLGDETLEFVCWTDEDGNEIAPETRVSGGNHQRQRIDLYVSVRRRLFYTVTFDGEGATSGSMDAQKIYRDEETALSSNAFKWTGHAFLGWAETNDLGRVKYADGTNVLNIAKAGDTNELHAVWQTNTYYIAFDPNGGTGEAMPVLTCKYDQPVKLPNVTYVRDLHRFTGWSNDVAKVIYTDLSKPVSNLCSVANSTNTLYAVWESTLSDLARAMGCYNLNWTNEVGASWFVSTTEWTDGSEISCVCDSSSSFVGMKSSDITSNGILHFWWKATGPQASVLCYTPTKDEIGRWQLEVDASYDEWHETNIVVNLPEQQKTANLFITHRGSSTYWIANMTWVPEGSHPEPVEGEDNVTISSAAVSDGKFTLSFKSDERFDYNLLTNANLLIDNWGVMGTKKVGDGSILKFEPQIIEGQPQLFYRVDTIQRK